MPTRNQELRPRRTEDDLELRDPTGLLAGVSPPLHAAPAKLSGCISTEGAAAATVCLTARRAKPRDIEFSRRHRATGPAPRPAIPSPPPSALVSGVVAL